MTATPGVTQTLTIEDFPRPDVARTLSPNGRAHWATKRACTRLIHEQVAYWALFDLLRPMPGHVTIYPTFIYPQARKRDDDNLATGVMKAVRDALVKGGYLDADDTEHLRQMPVEVRVEKGRRALVLRFEWEPVA